MYLDGDSHPACTITDIGFETPIIGRITFRGMGLVTHVRVAKP